MKIILKKKVVNLGALGDVVDVKRGYARNYLFPLDKAVLATEKNMEVFQEHKDALLKLESERLQEAEIKATQISGKVFKIFAKVGESGKLFGSVGKKEIALSISEELGIDIDKHSIRMPEGVIRNVGEFVLSVHLLSEINANFKVVILAQ